MGTGLSCGHQSRSLRSPKERIPDIHVASQEAALNTGKARGTPGSCHISKSAPDVSVHSRGTCFPCSALTFKKYPKIHVSTGEEFSGSGPDSTQGLRPRHRRERNPERPPRNSHGDWPFLGPPERVPEVPEPRIDSHHVCTWDSPEGKPRGTALWESLVGKTRGKTTDPLIHVADLVTLLLPLWRKAQLPARIRDED
ncbi:hypothetical protein MJG53_000063 [Ovis ammon polii x Ovis aries]|nr:hypothetical protein MJG53_000063 [Ovis ammon polii x Ovis aries]